MRKIFVLVVVFLVILDGSAQMKLTLDECLEMAVADNIQTKIANENIVSAQYARKSVLAKFFPRFSANGMYMYNTERAYIFPDKLDTRFGSLGINGFELNSSLFTQAFPMTSHMISLAGSSAYQYLYDMFTLDLTHVFMGQVGVMQPIWLGGRLVQSYKITKSIERMADISSEKKKTEIRMEVAEAYWRVVSVNQKVILANRYVALLNHLFLDVTEAEQSGVSTKSDVLQVRVKLNEAEASLAQATDGLVLSKMALCQLIGLPMKSNIELDTIGMSVPLLAFDSASVEDIEDILPRRKEIQLLQETQKIARAGVKLASAGLMPNIMAGANYVTTNPNMHNSFNKHFYGFFTAGVVVNLPIVHADAILAVKSAKHKAKIVDLQLQEAKEKIELQTTQSYQKLLEANKHLIRAVTAVSNAKENLDYAQAAFDEGLITMGDLMTAQTAWQKAETDRIDASIELKMAQLTYNKNNANFE